MNNIIRSTLALVLVLVGTNLAISGDQARFRTIHASPDAPPVDVVVNDVLRPFENVAYGEATGYASAPANIYNVKVTPTGAPASSAVLEGDLNLFYNQDYTVIAVDLLADIDALVLVDDNEGPPFRQSRLRFVHASPNAPAVDIKVQDGPFLFEDVEFKENGGYVTIPEGFYTLEVRPAGMDAVVLEIPGVYLQRGTTYTAVATGLLSGQPGLDVILTKDSRKLPLGYGIGRGPRDHRWGRDADDDED